MQVTIEQVVRAKEQGRRLSATTCYGADFGKFIEDSNIDIVLVGDSLGNVMLGYGDTTSVTLPQMIHHTRAVASVVKRPLLVADLPIYTYGKVQSALENARQLIQAGAQAVKLEGGWAVTQQVTALVRSGIPVMGHIGFTPQSIQKFGGHKVQGRIRSQVRKLCQDARALAEAGAFAIVLELMTRECAEQITRKVKIPTIGIGAGPACDGQILVLHDILGFNKEFKPKYVKKYADIEWIASRALDAYDKDVKSSRFPGFENSFTIHEK